MKFKENNDCSKKELKGYEIKKDKIYPTKFLDI